MVDEISVGYSDIFIISLFFLFVGVIGYLVSKRRPSPDDLFFAGRKLTWPIIGFSLIASNISTLTMIGLTADAFVYGISASSYEWMASLILVVLALFIAPIYIKNKINTVPEYFRKRYGKKVGNYFTVVALVISSAVNIAGPLYAGALLMNLFVPQISVWEASLGFAIFSVAYTALGGLSAVVYTDFFQSLLFLMISLIVCFAVFSQYDFDASAVIARVSEPHLEMINSIDSPFLPWLGLLTGVPILGFFYWCTDQIIIQRIIAARSISDARKGIFFGAALKLTILYVIVFPGIMALGLFPETGNPQDLYARFIVELIPAGVIGLVISGLLAAMMSSIDSALNSSATLITYDFYLERFPDVSDEHIVKVGRICVVVMMLFSLSWTTVISYSNGIWAYSQTFLTYLVPPLVCLLFFGIFSSRGRSSTALRTLIIGHIASFFIFVGQFLDWFNFHFTISAAIIFLVSVCVFLILSARELDSKRVDVASLRYIVIKNSISTGNKILAISVVIATLLTILPFIL